ncbi:MAG: NfeD family protein [Microcystaceae cyanobacterium]
MEQILREFPLIAGTGGTSFVYTLSPSFIWLIVGMILCAMELALPTAFVAFMMGLSAIAVGIIALILPSIKLQLVLWLLVSTFSIVFSRRWLTPQRKGSMIRDAQEGTTLTEIEAGEAGRVLYEGNSWRAICADDKAAIAANQTVYVVKRTGNTLIVLPENFSSFSSEHQHFE